jgi:hypothetical protein
VFCRRPGSNRLSWDRAFLARATASVPPVLTVLYIHRSLPRAERLPSILAATSWFQSVARNDEIDFEIDLFQTGFS